MKKTKQKWCLRILVWLVAVLVLLGVADSCRVQEDPHRTLVQGSLQELNDSWTLETDQLAVYDIPESMGESLMLSIRSTKQKFSLGLRAADGQETVFYTYDPGSGPAEMRLFAALPEGAAGKTLVLRCAARCIREAFYRAEDCFRIGGDEFAVIAAATDEEAVKAAVETLRRLCAEWDAKEEYPVSIAVGYAMQAGRTMTADELFMEADAAMYQNKAEIKKAVGGISR